VHWRLRVRRVYGKRVSRSRGGARRCGSEGAPLCAAAVKVVGSTLLGRGGTAREAGR
jgi:hypothetical protein